MPTAPALITAFALLLYQFLTFKVGMARGKYGVKAPATNGHDAFERRYRVQMNTLEQMALFLPALWLFFAFAPGNIVEPIGTLLGGAWLIGRILYAYGYYKESRKRMPGFFMALLSSSLLLLGALIGIGIHIFAVLD